LFTLNAWRADVREHGIKRAARSESVKDVNANH